MSGDGMGVAARRDLGALSDASGLPPFPERRNSLSQAALYAPIDEPFWGPVRDRVGFCSAFHMTDVPGIQARPPAAVGLTGSPHA